ncbi:HD domain-containing protein [Neptunomonas sp.]|uniref:HD domain-containing protein n=1 Tax=Neptunomonas sp. TaxID=1971898 RepID=UPI0025EEC7AA|nr:HD domain-containing protein [Neptunomonas sp.]
MHPFIQQISQLFAAQGHHSYGEDITQTEHAVQCAELAILAQESDDLICAALLHDIGHLISTTDIAYGNYKHDSVGAIFLSKHFGPSVTEPIRLHAQAKRYLCSVEPGYLDSLSAASLDSFNHQGGLMNDIEKHQFINESYAKQSLKLRRWDDEGKIQELSQQSFDTYLPHLNASFIKAECDVL